MKDSRSGRRSFDSKLISLLPLDEVPVHIHRFAARTLAIRKAPSASVESIEPRPPRPCEVGRPKGRRRKSRRQSQDFFSTCCALAPQLAATPWGGSPPRPLRQKICYSDCTENCPLRPLRAPRRFGIRKSASNSGHSPLRGLGGGLGGGLGDASPEQDGSEP